LFDHRFNRIFLDMDGVLADFDKAAIPLMDGLSPEVFEKTRGSDEFWKRINSNPTFFSDLPLMEDAMDLYDVVKKYRPIILTGVPKAVEAHRSQKIDWGLKHFGKSQIVIPCQAKRKSEYLLPGDVLVDDRTVYKHLWERAGGIYIVHKSAAQSLEALWQLGVLN